jgi:hypothetical protein
MISHHCPASSTNLPQTTADNVMLRFRTFLSDPYPNNVLKLIDADFISKLNH